LSMISSVAGMIPSAMMSETALLESSRVSKMASMVLIDSGERISRSVMEVTAPSVPSEATIKPVRS